MAKGEMNAVEWLENRIKELQDEIESNNQQIKHWQSAIGDYSSIIKDIEGDTLALIHHVQLIKEQLAKLGRNDELYFISGITWYIM